jgi:hypothetical protein
MAAEFCGFYPSILPIIMIDLTFPVVYTNSRHRCGLATLRDAFEQWFEANFKGEHGYSIKESEIYWIGKLGPSDGTVDVGSHSALSAGLRQGGNEGWIVEVSACMKLTKGIAFVPIYCAKVWSPTAGCDLASAILQASWDAFEPAPQSATIGALS